ncbi:predicted protein [Sclerotinia sclerotiorum 1980 UF-70]|uniref:Uncharacterized protein n=1 Tax=Sclerotinia sclerotiorum (strain ATCC 18683 / 1980 / Ss-1) TaxID=665079 RepID=A7EMC3_SCLS1|nr:predicted protein [Sclerotinia sclerotiorum 1980 UF-70]EDO03989.1 predicted protein [Sclerotinia sclerotiorum 1980 UF-70]
MVDLWLDFLGVLCTERFFLGFGGSVDLLPALVGVMTNAEMSLSTYLGASIVLGTSVSEVRDQGECEGLDGWWLFKQIFLVGE